MTRIEIYASRDLSLSEKQILLWLKDFTPENKEIHLTYDYIAAAVSIGARNVGTHINNLIEKGYISRKNNSNNGKNSKNSKTYVLLK